MGNQCLASLLSCSSLLKFSVCPQLSRGEKSACVLRSSGAAELPGPHCRGDSAGGKDSSQRETAGINRITERCFQQWQQSVVHKQTNVDRLTALLPTERAGKPITCSVNSGFPIEGATDFTSGWDLAAN